MEPSDVTEEQSEVGQASSPRQSSSAVTQQPDSSSEHPDEQPQATSSVTSGRDPSTAGFVRVPTGSSDGGQQSGEHTSCPGVASASEVEAGFVDFI